MAFFSFQNCRIVTFIICLLAIVAVRTAFKESFHKKGIVVDETTQIIGDSGFQGMQNLH